MLMEIIMQLVRDKRFSMLPAVFSASFPGSTLTAGATVPVTTNIPSDCHFIARYMNIATYTAGLVLSVATAPLLIQATDVGSSRSLFDQLQPIQNVCGGVAAAAGQGNLPFVWPEPWLIRAGGSFQIILNNVGGATVVRADVALVGFKLYPLRGTLTEL
jgi:hypothetical protein